MKILERLKKSVSMVAILSLVLQMMFIGATPVVAADSGFLPPSVVVSNTGWVAAGNVYASDNNRATASEYDDVVQYSSFNFGVPNGASINGIEVKVEGYRNTSRQAEVSLSGNAGGSWSSSKTTNLPYKGIILGSEGTQTLGSSVNMWGRDSWDYSEFTNDNFRLKLDATFVLLGGDLKIDYVAAKVYYTENTPPTAPTPLLLTDDTLTNDNTPYFTWNTSTDSESSQTISYGIEISSMADFSDTILSGGTAGLAYQTPDDRAFADGIYYWRVRANDGFISTPWSSTRSFTVDTIAPTAPTNGQPNGLFIPTNNFDFTWGNSSDMSSVTYKFQSSLNPAQTGGVLTTGLWESGILDTNLIHSSGAPDGTWYWQVRATDAASNVGPWSPIWKVTLDTVNPVVDLDAPVINPIRGLVDIRGTVVDANPHHYWFVVQGINGNVSLSPYNTGTINDTNSFTNKLLATWDTTSVADGDYTVKLEARDAAGNKGANSVSWKSVTVDNTAPTAVLVFDQGTGPAAKGFQVQYSEDVDSGEAENAANYFLQNWPGAGGSGDLSGHASIVYDPDTDTATVTFTDAGWYVSPEQLWGVQNIHDLAGNLMDPNPVEKLSTENQKPITTLEVTGTKGPNGLYNTAVTLDLSAFDPTVGSGVENTYYKFDDDLVYSIGNTLTVTADGEHTLFFYSEDNAGNVEEEQAFTFEIDQTPPVITLVGATLVTVTQSGSFTDPGAITDDGSTIVVTGVVNTAVAGIYALTYNATDSAGNSAVTKVRTITVVLPPVVLTPFFAAPTFAAATEEIPEVQGVTTEETPTPQITGPESEVKGSDDSEEMNDWQKFFGYKVFGVKTWMWLLFLAFVIGGWWFLMTNRKKKRT